MATTSLRILAFLEQASEGFDDDELAQALNISPRQTVNIACRSLERQGKIIRIKAAPGKIKNYPATPEFIAKFGAPAESTTHVKQPPRRIARIPSSGTEDRISGSAFEDRVRLYLQRRWNKPFTQQAVQVGVRDNGEPFYHRFDLVSPDLQEIGDCKAYTYTATGNIPVGKFATANETVYYLTRAHAAKRFVVMLDHQDLVERYVNFFSGLLDDVEVYALKLGKTADQDQLRLVRGPGRRWANFKT